MVNGCPLAIQHMSQQHQVATFNGMKDPAHCMSLKDRAHQSCMSETSSNIVHKIGVVVHHI